MRLVYVLLSPTFGMHQYTADLANRMAANGCQVHLASTTHCPRDRYSPAVTIHTPVDARNTGFSADGLRFWKISHLPSLISNLQPDLVHITGPHLWNIPLLAWLRRAGVPTIHTIHDVNPHAGVGYGRLLYAWNNLVYRLADHILVHGQCYRDQLVAQGIPPDQVTHAPLLHLFLSYESELAISHQSSAISYQPFALFLGRLEAYKGVNILIEAMRLLHQARSPLTTHHSPLSTHHSPLSTLHATIAGPGNLGKLDLGPLPPNVKIRHRLIQDDEAVELFSQCGLVVLPYIEASQSALIAAAYFFGKPVIVTRVGALPEYVQDGKTGWIVEPGNPQALAACLQEALSDPTRLMQMGQAGRAWYAAQRKAEFDTLQTMYTTICQ